MNELKLFSLYEDCTAYLAGSNEKTSHEIIECAVELLRDAKGYPFDDLFGKCACHLNMWNECTLQEQIAQGDGIVEDLAGYLGEYFA